MSHHPLDPTSHTIEMQQIDELNAALAAKHAPTVTTADLGLTGAPLPGSGGQSLSGHEVVVKVSWRGTPDFPDIYGEFGAAGSTQASTHLLLHTAQLRELSHLLHQTHHWGL
ncbi:hypothetical protein [Microlunatus ginsengisoli]|jgi:hypothetical protein|uniref:Uncharacterized protein n=1 Tax=Microlunatus ginsengisoli TaxID=363863 RepID=A0ABP6ZJ15_9ACTN